MDRQHASAADCLRAACGLPTCESAARGGDAVLVSPLPRQQSMTRPAPPRILRARSVAQIPKGHVPHAEVVTKVSQIARGLSVKVSLTKKKKCMFC